MTAKDFIEFAFTTLAFCLFSICFGAGLFHWFKYHSIFVKPRRRLRKKAMRQSQNLSDLFVHDGGKITGIIIKSPKE